jgi:23S rRNA pseudouridine1911/1915/1917 synthase
MNEVINIICDVEIQRIDSYLATKTSFSRAFLQQMISAGEITVNGEIIKQNYKVKRGEKIEIVVSPLKELNIEAEDIDIEILYEDDDIVVVNKPKGMVVHPALGNSTGTLVNALLKKCKGKLSGINGIIRPGIVHRIDKDTTGVLVIAKNDKAHVVLSDKFKKHDITREYIAIVDGVIPNDKGKIDAPIGRDKKDRKKMAVVDGGRHAVTYFTVMERYEKSTRIKVTLETGRTHQIRVHMSYIGYPISGDKVYGSRVSREHGEGQMLHAHLLGFEHPITGVYMEFSSPAPF